APTFAGLRPRPTDLRPSIPGPSILLRSTTMRSLATKYPAIPDRSIHRHNHVSGASFPKSIATTQEQEATLLEPPVVPFRQRPGAMHRQSPDFGVTDISR